MTFEFFTKFHRARWKQKQPFTFWYCVDNFYPWKDIFGKKVSKLRSFAELRAFYGMGKNYFFATLKSLKKEVESRVGSWSGSISQRYVSADPDPHQKVTDPQHCWFCHWKSRSCLSWACRRVVWTVFKAETIFRTEVLHEAFLWALPVRSQQDTPSVGQQLLAVE